MDSFDIPYILKLIIVASFSLIAGVFIYKTLKICWIIQKYKKIPGPKPKGLKDFYFGFLPEFIEYKKLGLNMVQFYEKKLYEYGTTCKLQILDQAVIITVDPVFLKEIFIDENYPKSKNGYTHIGFPFSERLMGYGIVTEMNHNIWKDHRSFLNPGFQRQALMSFIKEFNATSDILMVYLRKFADGKTKVILLEEFNRAALDVIAKVGFSMNIDSVNDRDNKLCQYVKESLNLVQLGFENPIARFNPFLRKRMSSSKYAIRKLRDLGREQIAERIKAMKNDDPVPNDILTTILMSNLKDKEQVDVEKLIDDFVTFFVAGQETTASTLAFIFRELGRNSDVLIKLRNEIDSVFGAKSDLDYQNLSELKYTTAVIKEALRLYPPAAMYARTSTRDFKLDKFTIPKDSTIMVSPYMSGRSEENFPEPLKFKPERFLNEGNSSTAFSYFPFSLGPRNCIGQNFAMVEAKIMITKFLQNFDFTLDPDERFMESLNLSLHPIDGTSIFLTIR